VNPRTRIENAATAFTVAVAICVAIAAFLGIVFLGNEDAEFFRWIILGVGTGAALGAVFAARELFGEDA
jgi:hypothetical protein